MPPRKRHLLDKPEGYAPTKADQFEEQILKDTLAENPLGISAEVFRNAEKGYGVKGATHGKLTLVEGETAGQLAQGQMIPLPKNPSPQFSRLQARTYQQSAGLTIPAANNERTPEVSSMEMDFKMGANDNFATMKLYALTYIDPNTDLQQERYERTVKSYAEKDGGYNTIISDKKFDAEGQVVSSRTVGLKRRGDVLDIKIDYSGELAIRNEPAKATIDLNTGNRISHASPTQGSKPAFDELLTGIDIIFRRCERGIVAAYPSQFLAVIRQ